MFSSQKSELLPFRVSSHKPKQNCEIHLQLEAPDTYFKMSVVPVVLAFP